MSGLRLLVVTPWYLPHSGGVEHHVYQVARRLVRAGVEVCVLAADPGGHLQHEEWQEGVRVLRARAWPARGDYCFAPEVWRLIRRGTWDLVHCQSYHTLVAPMAMSAALRSRIPYVLTFHGGGHSSHLRTFLRRPQLAAMRPLLARAERLIAVAAFEIGQYSTQLGLPRQRFALIPNGADLGDAPPPRREAPEGTVIMSVGRLERYKGHQRMIAALPAILQERPDARLWIAGEGPYEPALRRLAARLGVADRVEIRAVPMRDRGGMAAALASAALVTLLSEYETHPIAVLEAAALGRPVLVTATSGLRELADQGLARAISPRSTPEQVAAAALRLLGRPGHARPPVLPTWDDCVGRLLALYGAVIGGRRCAS